MKRGEAFWRKNGEGKEVESRAVVRASSMPLYLNALRRVGGWAHETSCSLIGIDEGGSWMKGMESLSWLGRRRLSLVELALSSFDALPFAAVTYTNEGFLRRLMYMSHVYEIFLDSFSNLCYSGPRN